MDSEQIISVLFLILSIIFGGIITYIKADAKLSKHVANLIVEAEKLYKDVTKSGGMKFNWVVDKLYQMVPKPLRKIISRKVIENLVQATFEAIEEYASHQLSKLRTNEDDVEEEKEEV